MVETIDTSRTIAVYGSRFGTVWKLIWSIVGFLVAGGLTALLIGLALHDQPIVPVFLLYVLSGLGVLLTLASLASIIECGMFLKISSNVLTISPDGIRDRRVAEELVPWQAVRSVRTAVRAPDHYYANSSGRITPIRRTSMDIVLDIDPALTSQTFRQRALLTSQFSSIVGKRDALEDTRPWITYTIDLWRLKNVTASTLYDICQAYATAAHARHAR
jgi:hypothetical protein